MALFIDASVKDGTLAQQSDANLLPIINGDSVSQDIKHRLIESGLLLHLMGLRDPYRLARLQNSILITIENDERVIPGTAKFISNTDGTFFITADTYRYDSPNADAGPNR